MPGTPDGYHAFQTAASAETGNDGTVFRAPESGSVLGFDFGESRIGVAVGELSVGVAHPLATVQSRENRTRIDAIGELIRQWQPVLLVVGLPRHMDGTEHELTRLCRRFAQKLESRFGIRTVLVDERLTSLQAAESLREAGIRGRKQKALLDQVAAQHILQSYFDENRHGTT